MSNAKPAPTFKRWYERQPQLAQAVKLLTMLPDEVTTILSEALIALSNEEFKNTEKTSAIRSVGSEKIMGVHKSKNRRREYDVNETLHKAMNYLYVLTEEGQDNMAAHVLDMVKFIHQYFSTCLEFKIDSKPEEVASITHKYVEGGSPAVDNFLHKLRQEFQVKSVSGKKTSDDAPDLLDVLRADNGAPSHAQADTDPRSDTGDREPIIQPRLRSSMNKKTEVQAREKDSGIKNEEVQARAKEITHKNTEIRAQVKANSHKTSEVIARTKDHNKNAAIKARLKANLNDNAEVHARNQTNPADPIEADRHEANPTEESLHNQGNPSPSTDDRLDLSAKDDKQGMKLSKLDLP
jgi:hypothetical protein